MAQINPPAFAHTPRGSSHKRKRSGSAVPSSSLSVEGSGGGGAINPLSYTPATLRQLHVAGHSDADLLPSTSVAQFPHRPLPPSPPPSSVTAGGGGGGGWDTEGADDGENDGRQRQQQHNNNRAEHADVVHRFADRHLGALTAVMHRALEEGDVARAARAYGLLVRSEVWGRPVDLRRSSYWAVGAEILMRQGEQDKNEGDGLPRRWGRAANMPAVRDFFMALIHQYPYNKFNPRAVSALDFWPALLGCELYNTHVEHVRALRRLEMDEAEDDSADSIEEGWSGGHMDEDEDDEDGDDGAGDRRSQRAAVARTERCREARDQLRRDALRQMREVARTMDDLMVGPPYSVSHELLRLRGMVALYMGDLAMPPARRRRRQQRAGEDGGGGGGGGGHDVELHEARIQRDTERERARRRFSKILEDGGEVEDWIRDFVTHGDGEEEGDDDDNGGSIINFRSLSSPLPIRGRR